MSSRVLYAELTPSEFGERIAKAPIAYLPLGTLEWHGSHLPLGSDGLISQGFLVRLAGEVGGVVLPTLFVGPDRREVVGGREFYGMDVYSFPDGEPRQLEGSAYWASREIFGGLLKTILKQISRAGFKIVVAHGHGPSTSFFRAHSAEWGEEYGLTLLVCWRDKEANGMGIQTNHAAANETSLMMYMRPELVQMRKLPSDPEEWPEGVSGADPRTEASAETGRLAVQRQVERMAGLLRDLMPQQ